MLQGFFKPPRGFHLKLMATYMLFVLFFQIPDLVISNRKTYITISKVIMNML